MPKNFDLRRARKGKGVLPPNPNRWEHEHNALDLRHALELSLDARLVVESAFELLRNVFVVPHGGLTLPSEIAAHFTGTRSGKWSGMCVPYPDLDATLVIYNDAHAERRVRATLMEEFFHLWLGHPPTKLRTLSNGSATRDFRGEVESEAYGSGAAALVPYKALRQMAREGFSAQQIADHFLVSEQLVHFRAKVVRVRL